MKKLIYIAIVLLIATLAYGEGSIPGGINTPRLPDSHNVTIDNAIDDPVQVEITDGVDTADVVTHADRNTDVDGLNGAVTASVGYGRIDDDTVKPVRLDATTHAQIITSYPHHEIHEGSVQRVFRNKDVVGSGTFNICFTTPNTTKLIHFTLAVSHELEADFKFYEGVTSWTGGTGITPVNARRGSGASTITDMVFDCTITLGSPTTLIHEVGGSGKKFGAASDHDAEWILAQNTTYFMIITNQSTGAAANESNYELDWYAHTDRD